ncbi:hypothetical protein RRG08_019473 [Elysia crispata]|uniref:Uncharacterized protein n=1 Tax=Elysia crispata TaxID=231223 RepID=A0AAE1DV67_9GAST|nr:hypothetical protein RRG08_019473 [Elysia crispata]
MHHPDRIEIRYRAVWLAPWLLPGYGIFDGGPSQIVGPGRLDTDHRALRFPSRRWTMVRIVRYCVDPVVVVDNGQRRKLLCGTVDGGHREAVYC